MRKVDYAYIVLLTVITTLLLLLVLKPDPPYRTINLLE